MNLLERCLGVDPGWKAPWGGVGTNPGLSTILVCTGTTGGASPSSDAKSSTTEPVLHAAV